ncbi:MAG: transglycosylase family protein [Chloroflexi bacterium]|nr:transglycosylase family protein [Chloroflexota bacterium]
MIGRVRATATATITAILLAALIVPSITQAVDPPNIDHFMAALGSVESNGRYDAVNATSGAFGKYQIMPASWAAWSLRYLGNANAEPTPANQEDVARHKITALYNWLGNWPAVAHWWLTGDGDPDPNHWSAFARQYVNRVMAAMGAPGIPTKPSTPSAPRPSASAAAITVFDESNDAVQFSGGWGAAEFAGYLGGQVRYAVAARTSVWFDFTGDSIAWIGPKGPTRGQARLYLDDVLVRTVDVYAPSFRPRAVLFSTSFDRVGSHRIRIEVLGTPGRPTIALDEFDVGDSVPITSDGAPAG